MAPFSDKRRRIKTARGLEDVAFVLLNLGREGFKEAFGLVREVVGQKQTLRDDGVATHLAGCAPLLIDQLRDGIAELTKGVAVGESPLLDAPERHSVVEGAKRRL